MARSQKGRVIYYSVDFGMRTGTGYSDRIELKEKA